MPLQELIGEPEIRFVAFWLGLAWLILYVNRALDRSTKWIKKK